MTLAKLHPKIETELRARIDSKDFHLKLAKARATFVSRHIMRDFLFDDVHGSLSRKKQKLRLRMYDNQRTVVTWKSKRRGASLYKEEYEHEVEIGDFETMMYIFRQLGFRQTFRIDRRVELYRIRDVLIRLEFFPEMDDLVEIEGPRDQLEDVIRALGMRRSDFNNKGQEYFFRAYEERTERKPRLFYRKEGFSQSVGAMVLNSRNQVLLVFQKKSQYWEFPKGREESGEQEFDTLKRELAEETGITRFRVKEGFREKMFFDFILDRDTLIHREVTYYLLETNQEPRISPREHTAWKWVKLSAAKRYLKHPNQWRLVDKVKYYLAL